MMDQGTKKENIVAGLVGAFLGSLLGVVCIVVLGQLGYVAAISGIVMGVCALKGYEKFGGCLSKKGAVISVVLIFVMTYFAHRLDWAISVAQAYDNGIIRAYQSIDRLLRIGAIKGSSYWSNLGILYLFTLLGSIPTVVQGLRNDQQGPRATEHTGYTDTITESAQQLEIFSPEKGYGRRLRLSIVLSILIPLVIGLAILMVAFTTDEDWRWMLAALCAMLATLGFTFATLPISQVLMAETILIVRGADKTLWRIQLMLLNTMPAYRFSSKTGAFQPLTWSRLTPEEQHTARRSIHCAMEDIRHGRVFPGNTLNRILIPLSELTITKENSWCWKGTYQAQGTVKKVVISKGYPGLRPTAETELSHGQLPYRWGLCATAAVCTLALAAVGWVCGMFIMM